jgi:hypothetical protein
VVFELALLQYFSPDLLDQRSEQQRLNRTSVRAVEAQQRALDAEAQQRRTLDAELEDDDEGDMAEGEGATAAAASASMPMLKSKNKFAPRKALYIAPLKSATYHTPKLRSCCVVFYSHSVRCC